MKWIELIIVQTADLSETTLQYIYGLTKEIGEIPGLLTLEVYRHAVISGNIALLLIWVEEPPQPQGSTVGLQLLSEVKKYGLVAHSIWLCKE